MVLCSKKTFKNKYVFMSLLKDRNKRNELKFLKFFIIKKVHVLYMTSHTHVKDVLEMLKNNRFL